MLEMKYFKSDSGRVCAFSESDLDIVRSIESLEIAAQSTDKSERESAISRLDGIDRIFFQIRDSLKELREMTAEEVDAHINPPRTITAESLKSEITALRWQHETGGITLPSGVRVATGIDDQNRITSVIANAQIAGVQSVDLKAASGWVTVTVQELQAIAAAIAVHVQACFTAERVHHEAIDALAEQHEGESLQAALAAYDVQSGWPV